MYLYLRYVHSTGWSKHSLMSLLRLRLSFSKGGGRKPDSSGLAVKLTTYSLAAPSTNENASTRPMSGHRPTNFSPVDSSEWGEGWRKFAQQRRRCLPLFRTQENFATFFQKDDVWTGPSICTTSKLLFSCFYGSNSSRNACNSLLFKIGWDKNRGCGRMQQKQHRYPFASQSLQCSDYTVWSI